MSADIDPEEKIVVSEYDPKHHQRVFELCEEMAYCTDTYGQSWKCLSSKVIRMFLLALLIYMKFHWSVWIIGGLCYETLIIAYTYIVFNWGYARYEIHQKMSDPELIHFTATPGSNFFIAQVDRTGYVVGTAGCFKSKDGARMSLTRMMVDPLYKKIEISSQLVDAVKNHTRGEGIHQVSIATLSSNEPGVLFYDQVAEFVKETVVFGEPIWFMRYIHGLKLRHYTY